MPTKRSPAPSPALHPPSGRAKASRPEPVALQNSGPRTAGSAAPEEFPGAELSAEVLEQILIRRAAIAARPLIEEERGERVELALIRIGKELYGLDVQSVLDIHPCANLTRLPRVPRWIPGVTNIGGHILAVLDLQSFLGLAPAPTQAGASPSKSFLIRLSTQDIDLALLVDEVLSIENIAKGRIQENTDATRGLPPEYVRGVYNRNTSENSLVLILDLSHLLADPRLTIQEELL